MVESLHPYLLHPKGGRSCHIIQSSQTTLHISIRIDQLLHGDYYSNASNHFLLVNCVSRYYECWYHKYYGWLLLLVLQALGDSPDPWSLSPAPVKHARLSMYHSTLFARLACCRYTKNTQGNSLGVVRPTAPSRSKPPSKVLAEEEEDLFEQSLPFVPHCDYSNPSGVWLTRE